jgi:hypothetical protein
VEADRFAADYRAPEWLNALRTRGNDLHRGEDWAGLWAARDQLRRDEDFWPSLWGPLCAVAARRLGDPGAWALLEEVAAAGFFQPELLDGQLEAAFGADPDWPQLLDRIVGNVPPAPLEFLDWPSLRPAAPLELFRLPAEREQRLRELLPESAGTAWETATRFTSWVSSRWRHSDGHMDIDDAVTCLERVDAGHRFACVEYALVLCQALNAVGMPSRRLALRRAGYHAGLGQGHVVSEAWIDGLDRWVVLDGQNGMYWTDGDGMPLGAVELCELNRSGGCASAVVIGGDITIEEADWWFSYFHATSTTGGSWSDPVFVPVFQVNRFVATDRLQHTPAALYPDLSDVGVGTVLADDRPAIRLLTDHPFADGFTVRAAGHHHQVPADAPVWPLTLSDGDHTIDLAVRTRYGTLTPRGFRYRVR